MIFPIIPFLPTIVRILSATSSIPYSPCIIEETVIDVSASWDAAKNTIVGDADESAASVVDAITPVPGGVGAVTSTVLMAHVIRAAERAVEGGCL